MIQVGDKVISSGQFIPDIGIGIVKARLDINYEPTDNEDLIEYISCKYPSGFRIIPLDWIEQRQYDA